MKGHNSFSFLWKFESQFIEWFWRNSLLKTRNFTGDVRLINFFATQFRSFWCLIFPSILLAKSWKLHKLLNLISSSTFAFSSYIRPPLVLGKSYANEQKCKQWRQQRFAYRIQVLLCKTEFVKKSALFHMIEKKNTIDSNACGLTYFYGSANSRAKKGL